MFIKLSTSTKAFVLGIAALTVNITLWRAFPIGLFWPTAAGLLLLLAAMFDSRARIRFIASALLFPLSYLLILVGNHLIVRATPHIMDAAFGDLGHNISLRFYQWTLHQVAFYRLLGVVYQALIFFIAVTVVSSDRRSTFLRCAVFAAVVAPLCYVLFPAVGPAHVGDPNAARNCMPSLHVTWAILCLLHIARRFRWIAAIFLGLTLTAVIGLGEHYLIDIAGALPFTAFVVFAEFTLWRGSRRIWFAPLVLPAGAVALERQPGFGQFVGSPSET
jgi:hypothetical protein